MHNPDSVFSLEDNQALILAVGEIITPKIKQRDQFEHLNPAEQTFIYLDVFEAALHTGSLESFFLNSGQFTHEIIGAYSNIKAYKTVRLLEQAMSVFPDKKVPKNKAERLSIIKGLHESTRKHWESLFNQLFESGEPVADLLATYIRKNQEQFMPLSNTQGDV
ncbi:MAG: hypothetical protein COA80_04360 [Leeuwenhoekiella sp.]|nr:MAG: hypothetical protein COA80_04360 [Leeuwenhoekiella sp.]